MINWLDIIVIVILGLGTWKGYQSGFLNSLAGIVALIIAILFAGIFQGIIFELLLGTALYDWTSNTLGEQVGFYSVPLFGEFLSHQVTMLALNIIAYLLVFLIIFGLLRFAVSLVSGVVDKIPIVGSVNKFLGIIIGFLKSLLFIWILLIIVFLFYEPTHFGIAMWLAERNLILYFIFN